MIEKMKKGFDMLKKLFLTASLVFFVSSAMAQEVFWGFDENDRELIIPPECDSSLEAQELFEAGMRLLEETGYAKQGAPYCLIAAALDNHSEAQFQIARLYQKGILLPKSDLAAYKWATLAALNGHVEADRLGASIEQFLSIQDIETSTRSLESLIPVIAQSTQKELDAEVAKQEKIKEEIAVAAEDIKDLKKYGEIRSKTKRKAAAEKKQNSAKNKKEKSILTQERENRTERARADESIFSQEDLDNAPMPSIY